MTRPKVFRTPTQLRSWLEKHHDREPELWIGFYRKASGKPCVSYSEALDLALCFGWIDGIRKKVDDITYTNRFTPRRPRSVWSHVNVQRVETLLAKGAMHAAGLVAFSARTEQRTGIYSFERKEAAELDPSMRRQFQSRKRAWAFFEAQAPWYRRTAIHWVMAAKKPETRARRFGELLDRSGDGAFIGPAVQGGRKPRPVPGAAGLALRRRQA